EASEMPENVELQDRPIKEIKGGLKVGSLIRTDGSEIEVDGVFILRNSVAPANLLHGLELDGPHIKVDRQCRTNIKGCFACGDCTGRPYQITKDVGEGNVAAHEVLDYLAELDKE
ncbi:MAG: FAD-dependent oxidoreductase, partial [Firmicutes bacterium]|nr:FAD-dependent oxidoreductase [Bacillota bacterium]